MLAFLAPQKCIIDRLLPTVLIDVYVFTQYLIPHKKIACREEALTTNMCFSFQGTLIKGRKQTFFSLL